MSSWITKMHPDDVAMASEAMGKQLSDPSGQTVFDMEYRMLHKDGEYRWVRASSMVVWSQDRKRPLMAAGTILDIKVTVGQQVKEGDLVAILEAMKMENEIFASKTGSVAQIIAPKGSTVDTGDAIITIS